MSTAAAIVICVVAYFLGTFPTAVLVGRQHGFDPTTEGSGNPGASNAARIGGARAGAVVLAGDAGKGAIAAAIGYAAGGSLWAWIAGSAAIAGHLWPVTRRFKGGKGVATAAGVGVVCAPVGAAVLALVFFVLVKATGRAAVGSLVAVGLLPVTLAVLGSEPIEIGIGVAITLVIVIRHKDNIRRLLAGTEGTVRG